MEKRLGVGYLSSGQAEVKQALPNIKAWVGVVRCQVLEDTECSQCRACVMVTAFTSSPILATAVDTAINTASSMSATSAPSKRMS